MHPSSCFILGSPLLAFLSPNTHLPHFPLTGDEPQRETVTGYCWLQRRHAWRGEEKERQGCSQTCEEVGVLRGKLELRTQLVQYLCLSDGQAHG